MGVFLGQAVGGMVVGALMLAAGAVVLLVKGLWKGWWLHPLWAVVMVPLGVPAIPFWPFVALAWFLSAFRGYYPAPNIKSEYLTDHDMARNVFVAVMYPVLTFYLARWAVQ